MSSLQFSGSWHIWRGSVLLCRYSFCCGFRERGPCEWETGHLSTSPLINRHDNEAHSQLNTPGVSFAWVPCSKTTFSKFISQRSNYCHSHPLLTRGGGSTDLLLITWSITSSRLCNFHLHHNPFVSCRRWQSLIIPAYGRQIYKGICQLVLALKSKTPLMGKQDLLILWDLCNQCKKNHINIMARFAPTSNNLA